MCPQDGDDVREGLLPNRCALTFLFTQANELTQLQEKDLVAIKVELEELLMDVRSITERSSMKQILGSSSLTENTSLIVQRCSHQASEDIMFFVVSHGVFVPA